MRKLFSTYLNESKKSWKFSIKTIHDLSDEQCDRIEKHLGKYDSKGLGAAKKTILQSAPRDFPNHKGYEVYTHAFETDRIASGWQIQYDIRNMLGLADGVLKVKGEHEPEESIPPFLATLVKTPAPLPVEPGKEPNDLFKLLPKVSVRESPIIPSDNINVSKAPESKDP